MGATPYLVMKLIHLLAVVAFLGNIVVSLFWKLHGDRTRDVRIVAHTLAGIIAADRLFTLPGVALLVLAGFGTAGMGHYPLMLPWIIISIILFAGSGGVYMGIVSPMQKRMLAMARRAENPAAFDWGTYASLSKQWNLWGLISLALPLVAMVLMVMKPV